jgi:hypothetical protein
MNREVKNNFVMVRLSRSDLAMLDCYAEFVGRNRPDAIRLALHLAANLIGPVLPQGSILQDGKSDQVTR